MSENVHYDIKYGTSALQVPHVNFRVRELPESIIQYLKDF